MKLPGSVYEEVAAVLMAAAARLRQSEKQKGSVGG